MGLTAGNERPIRYGSIGFGPVGPPSLDGNVWEGLPVEVAVSRPIVFPKLLIGAREVPAIGTNTL